MKEIKLYDVVSYAGHEWFVIEIDNDKVTLLAKNDDFGHRCFDENFFGYEDSEIRKYLNTIVLNELTENGACLETVTLEDLEDKVYLLLSERKTRDLPEYVRKFSNWWWIGSLGFNSYSAIYVDNDGNTYPNGILTTKESGSVRPAIIVKIVNLQKSLELEPKMIEE